MAFSYKEYTTRSSGQREFTFAFDAVAKDTTNIKVTIGGVHLYDGVTEYNTTTRLPGSGSTPAAEYTVSSGSITIKSSVTFTVGSTTVTAGVPTLSSSVPLRIFRKTNRDTAEVTFSSGSILADSDLNKANNQARFLSLEAVDRADESISIDSNDSTQYNIQIESADKRIFGVATPTNANDAVPKSYADSTVSSAEEYRDSAQDYRDTAESYATRIDGPAQTFSGAADNTSGTGTNTSDYSAKNWAVGVHASNTPSEGSAKEWAIGGEGTVGNAVSGGEYSAKKHAQDASTSASSASDSATAAAASAAATARVFDSFDDKYLGQMADTTSATTASTTGTWAINSSVITVASATDIIVGQEVTGSGIPSDANVIAISGTSITISENMAAAGTGVSLTFTGQGVYGNFDSSKDGPSTDNDGDALVSGSLYFNTTDGEMRVYDGSNWIAASAAQNATILEYVYDITGSVTSIVGASGTGFAENNGAAVAFGSTESVHVYLNGVQLIEGASDDYQLTPSTNTVTLNSAAVSGDIVKIVVYKTFTVGDAVPASTGGTFSGNVSFGDNNITNVGDISLDTISSDAGTSIGVTLGTDAGDDFNVGSGKLVVEGDTGNVGIGTTASFGGSATKKYLSILNTDGTDSADRPAVIELASSNKGDGVRVGEITAISDVDGGDDEIVSFVFAQDGTTTNNVGGKIRLQTKADGGALADRMVIDQAGDITVNTGNLVIGTAGQGISFSNYGSEDSNSATTVSSNLLDDYEEGTWSPTTASDSTGTISNNFGHYVKIGRSVLLHGRVQITANFTSSSIGGMPFTCNHLSSGGSGNQSMAYTKTDSGDRYVMAANGLDTLTVRLVSTDGSAPPQSGQIFRFTISYTTTA